MWTNFSLFLQQTIKLFFLLTPFFALSMFLAATDGISHKEKRVLALKISLAVYITGLILIFFGRKIFFVFGITVDAFRVGAGLLLLLSAIRLNGGKVAGFTYSKDEDITVVPFSIPIIIGPATIGALVVMSADSAGAAEMITNCVAFILAATIVGLMLFLSSFIEKFIGRKGLGILAKITSLILAALSAQMILMGVRALLYGN